MRKGFKLTVYPNPLDFARAPTDVLALAGRNPPRSRITEALRLRELMWIASAFVFLDDQSNPHNVPALYTKMIDVDKVYLLARTKHRVMYEANLWKCLLGARLVGQMDEDQRFFRTCQRAFAFTWPPKP